MRGRENNFDLMRLVMASCVIFGHSPELIDGNRRREPLTLIFHTVSLGEVAVFGFFIVSGYLITRSWMADPNLRRYAANRFLRIVPGYATAFLVAVFLIGPLGVTNRSTYFATLPGWLALDFATLGPPNVPGVFQGLHVPLLNGAIWTIRWEAVCYLATPLLVWSFHARRRIFFAVGGVLVALTVLNSGATSPARNLLMFWAGSMAAMEPSVGFKRRWLAVAALVPLMFVPIISGLAFAALGTYVVLGLGLATSVWQPPRDISYGVFLYGWPTQALLLSWGMSDPLLLALSTLVLAAVLGCASQLFIEGPAQRLRMRHPATASTAGSA